MAPFLFIVDYVSASDSPPEQSALVHPVRLEQRLDLVVGKAWQRETECHEHNPQQSANLRSDVCHHQQRVEDTVKKHRVDKAKWLTE